MNRRNHKNSFKNMALVVLVGAFSIACPPSDDDTDNGPINATGGEGQPCRADLSCQEGLSCVFKNGEDVCLPTVPNQDSGVLSEFHDSGTTLPPGPSQDGGTTSTPPPSTDAGSIITNPETNDAGSELNGSLIGSEGGTVYASGFSLEIPAGALTEPTLIEVSQRIISTTDAFQSYSAEFGLAPEGLQLNIPAELQITHMGPSLETTIFQSEDGTNYDNIGGIPHEHAWEAVA